MTRPYVAVISTPSVSAYTAPFTARGLTLVAEQRDDLTYQVHAVRTTGGALFGTPQADRSLVAAVNALLGAIGIPVSF